MKTVIGLLVPRSSIVPNLGIQFVSGFRLGLSKTFENAEVQIEDIGTGGLSSVVMEKSHRLQLQHMANVLVGLTGNPVMDTDTRDFFHENTLPFFLVNAGANKMRFEPSPFVFFHSLGLAKSCAAFGNYSARELGKKVAVLNGFHESGYEIYPTFLESFEKAGGTLGMLQMVREDQPFQIGAFTEQIEQTQSKVAFSLLSGPPALQFLKDFSTSSLNGKIPLATTPFALDAKMLVDGTFQNLELYIPTSWDPFSPNESQQQFYTEFKSLTRQAPNAFGLLGYETGLMVGTFQNTPFDESNSDLSYLNLDASQHPRKVSWDDSCRLSNANTIIQKISWKNGVFGHEILNSEDLPGFEMFEKYTGNIRSGWTNPYLCI